jgi:hypothetical protein
LQQLPIKQTKQIFESMALQHFQKFAWFGFERNAL